MRLKSGLAGSWVPFKSRPLWQQLALLVVATAVPFLVVSLFMFNRLVAIERDNIRRELMVNAKTVAALVDNEIATHAAIASTLAQSAALRKDDLAAFWLEAKNALEFVPGAWMAVSDSQGQIVLNTLKPLGTVLPKHAAFDVIQRAFAERQPQVGNLLIGPVAQRLTGFVEVPVFRDGKPAYSLSISLVPARFLALISHQFTHGEVVAIVDAKQFFVARVPDHDKRIGTLASDGWRAAMDSAPEGWVENATVEGNMSLTAYTRASAGWSVGIARLESDIAKPLMAIFWAGALAAGLLALLSFAFAAWIAHRASRCMALLASAAEDLRDGRPLSRPAAAFAEAATIATVLEGASVELAHRAGQIDIANRKATEALEATVAERTAELVAEMKRRSDAESTLRQTQKMESIGQLTGGIAHDFNNMLTIIMGNLDTLQRRLKSGDTAASLSRPVESALQGARNAAKLTHRLLAFSRLQPLEPMSLHLDALVASLSDMLARTLGEGIKLETVSGAGLWPVFADSNQMENCLVNLAVNARDAMAGHGKLTIESSNAFLDDAYATRFSDLKAGQYVMLSVSDTGSGIAAELIEKVFEPFFTTKPAGQGTGLGLAMIHGFVKQSGGHIRIYSEVGIGTSVKIYLPRYDEAVGAASAPRGGAVVEQPLAPAIPGETILVVEDDSDVRDFAIAALKELGYHVLAVADAEDALRVLAKASRVDALFTDVVLGGSMNGRQLAERVSALRPSIPVLFTTGYTRNAIVHQGRLDKGVRLLHKPYTLQELAGKIRAAITSGI